MLLIHVPIITNRLKYIFSFIIRDILRTEFDLTTDQEKYIHYQGPKFCYGKQPIQETLFFSSHNLLFEEDVFPQKIDFERWKDSKIFFLANSGSALPFDLFAASFYLISRYPEYLPHTRDRHGRSLAEDSINFKAGFLDRPIVNLWAQQLKLILSEKLNLNFTPTRYSFIPTIDINNAFAYQHKGAKRNAISLFDSLLKFQFKRLSKRVKVIAGMEKDPFDSYEEQNKIHNNYGLKPLYFVLTGDYGKYDKNLSHTNPHYISLIQTLDKTGEVCFHPSYASGSDMTKLLLEKTRLEEILQRPVTKSRHHYIRISLPHTYRELIKIGIKEDYSMGYASKVGFRQGTCTPSYFFDLYKNEQTELKIFPLTIMDTTLKHYLRMRSKDVVPFLRPIVDEIKYVGGRFVFNFHNESIANSGRWKNWGSVYEQVIKLAMEEMNVNS
jgi:hypothetical protein